MAAAKAALRKRMRAVRDAITPEVAAAAAPLAAERVLSTALANAPAMVGLYAAVRSELGTQPLIETLLGRNTPVAFPRVVRGQRRMVFHRVTSLEDLHSGYAGILEPAESAPVVSVEHIDLFIVPGIAFDARGNRLGWGRGHYDVTLADHSHAKRVGFAFQCQVIDAVPSTSNDLPMDLVVTEQRVYHSGRGSNEGQ